MALYDGVPSIRLEGDKTRALALIPEAKALLYTVQTVKKNMGVSTFAMTRAVGDDGVLYVLSTGNQNILHISVATVVPEQITEEPVLTKSILSPDFLSGIVFNGFLENRTETLPSGEEITYAVCARFAPTPSCQETEDLRSGRQDSARLAVTPWVAFDELNSTVPAYTFSQYTKLRSSMYSGKMRKVAQIAMGLGRIGIAKMRDGAGNEPDTKYMEQVEAGGVQLRYDWRFIRTHGITTGGDGRLWLIEISSTRGVIARLLPMFPDSDTAGFFARYEALKDRAMVTALEELGCLPTGEAFPTGSELTELITSGDVLQLLTAGDLSDFYACSPYSSAMGWVFNSRGTEAHNTAYKYGDDGFQRGVWYQVNISIGPLLTDPPPKTPIAIGIASLVKQADSPIYCPPARQGAQVRYVPIKFHEPLLDGLLSHEGVPEVAAHGLPPPQSDVVMFVMFVDDELKTVRYFRNAQADVNNTVDDELEGVTCPYGGSWTTTRTYGLRSFPTMMYTNDFDDRKVLQANVNTALRVSTRLGYDPPTFSDYIEAPSTSYVSRYLIFRETTTVTDTGGEVLLGAVVIPAGSREAYYYATGGQLGEGKRVDKYVGYTQIKDPNVGYAWRCFAQLSAPPFPEDRPDCNTRVCRGDAPCSSGGRGFPKERRVVCLAVEPADCSELADSGEWLSLCENVDGFRRPEIVRPSTYTTQNMGTEDYGELYLVSQGYGGSIQIPVTYGLVNNHWMRPSPDPETGTIQRISASHSAIGNDVILYENGLSSYGGESVVQGYTPENIVPRDGIPTFIGVNAP
jgi:hypothetical protein